MLILQQNDFSGTIPSCIGGYGALTNLDLGSNAFVSSPFPSFLAKLTNLKILYLYENSLTSSLPSFFANFESLQFLALGGNSLTGSLDLLCDLPKNSMHFIGVNSNEFTSTLPSCLLDFPVLLYLNIGYNALTGSIPMTDNTRFYSLVQLAINNNQFSGNIPVQLQLLTNLVQLRLNNNLFGSTRSSRPLPPQLDFINPQTQTSLSFVDISNNPLTGQLSTTFFRLPQLELFSAAVMCLDNGATLPEAICQATNLKYLVLSGLTSHPICSKQISGLGFLNDSLPGLVINGTNPKNFMR